MENPNRVEEIKSKVSTKSYSTWQEAYGDFLYLRKQKIGTVDSSTIIELSNLTIRNGLQFLVDPDAYLAVIKFLAALYIQTGDYDRAINELNLVVQLQADVPCWVYHNYIDAELHIEKKLDRILRKPKNFLDDLAKDNSLANEEIVYNRQQNILKELFRQASKYIFKNPGYEFAKDDFILAAKQYNIQNSIEFKVFIKTIGGADPTELYKADEDEKYKKLFDEAADKNKKLTESNHELQKQKDTLASLNTDLSNQNANLSSKNDNLTSENQNLSAKNDSLTKENETLGAENSALSASNAALNKDIENAKKELESTKSEIEELKQSIEEKKEELETMLKAQSDSFDKEKAKILQDLSDAQDKLIKKDKFIEERTATIKELRIQITKMEEAQKKASMLPPYLMIAKCLRPVTDAVFLWSKKKFPDMDSQTNWNQFVLRVFDPDQLEEDGIHHLDDLDLYRLIRMITDYENYGYLIGDGWVTGDDKYIFSSLLKARNRYAHFPVSDDGYSSQYISDLQTIKRFLEFINVTGTIRTEIREYLESL